MSNYIHEREIGTIPISIGTSLAFAGLYNKHPDTKPQKVLPASRAKIMFINARTLFRNIFNAIGDTEKASSVSPDEYASTILQEMDEINAYLSQESHKIEAVLYLPTYASLAKYAGNGNLRELKTPKQIKFNYLENEALKHIVKMFESYQEKPYLDVDLEIKNKEYQNVFILSHYPIDLLNVKNADEVLLLESNTGVVKNIDLWHTKFKCEKNSFIPFNKATLLFFGDSGGMFKGQPIKARTRLIEIAKEKRLNSRSTKSRLMLAVELAKEPFLLKTLRELFK